MSSENKAPPKFDPLYIIFEQHLFHFQDPNADRSTFCETIVKEYLTRMRKLGMAVPVEWEPQIAEELFFQVNSMLVKKIYGCHTIDEYTANLSTAQKRKARARYRRLDQAERRVERAAKIQKDKKAA